MNDPPRTPTFPPRRGLTPEEQKKVDAFIKAGKMTICPPVGSKELAAMEIKKYLGWLATVGNAMKIKLGYIPLKKPEETPKQKRQRRKEYEKEWHRKRKDKT